MTGKLTTTNYFVQRVTAPRRFAKPVQCIGWMPLNRCHHGRMERRTEAQFASHVVECRGNDFVRVRGRLLSPEHGCETFE
jgi:hypothetical protein